MTLSLLRLAVILQFLPRSKFEVEFTFSNFF
jgi:hypothetical protein